MMKSMIPTWIENISSYYSLWGFLPGTPTRVAKSSLLRSIIFILQVFLCSWCTYCTWQTFEFHSNIMGFLDVYCGFSLILYWFILCDSFMSRCDQHGFWQTYTRINESFCNQLQIKRFDYFFTLFIHIIGGVLIFYFAFASQGFYSNHVMHLIFMNILDNRMFFYFLHLKIIGQQL